METFLHEYDLEEQFALLIWPQYMLTISFFYPKIYPLVSQIFSKISLDFVLQRQIIHITFRKLVFKKLDIHTE